MKIVLLGNDTSGKALEIWNKYEKVLHKQYHVVKFSKVYILIPKITKCHILCFRFGLIDIRNK